MLDGTSPRAESPRALSPPATIALARVAPRGAMARVAARQNPAESLRALHASMPGVLRRASLGLALGGALSTAGCGTGYPIGADCDDDAPKIHPGASELCNNLDDNCNKVIDEGNPGGGAQCGVTVGACKPGTLVCVHIGLSAQVSCTDAQGGEPETCNGKDDDCNGQTDESFPDLGKTCDSDDADSLRDALARLAEDREFDVLLCDLMMPGVSGIDFYEYLQREAPDQLPRVIFLSCGAFTPRAQAFLDRVPNPHVEKPFELDELRDVIPRTLASTPSALPSA